MDQTHERLPQTAGGDDIYYISNELTADLTTYSGDISPSSAAFRQEFLRFPASLRDCSSIFPIGSDPTLSSNLLNSNHPLQQQLSSSKPSSASDAIYFINSPVDSTFHHHHPNTEHDGPNYPQHNLFSRRFQNYDMAQLVVHVPPSLPHSPIAPNPFDLQFSGHVVESPLRTSPSSKENLLYASSPDPNQQPSWPFDLHHRPLESKSLSSEPVSIKTEHDHHHKYMLSSNASQDDPIPARHSNSSTPNLPPRSAPVDPNLPKAVNGIEVKPEWGLTKAGKARQRLPLACINCRNKKIKCIVHPNGEACDNCLKNVVLRNTCRTEERPRRGITTKQGTTSRIAKRRDSTQTSTSVSAPNSATMGGGGESSITRHERKIPISRRTSLALHLANTQLDGGSPEASNMAPSPDTVFQQHDLPYLGRVKLSPTKHTFGLPTSSQSSIKQEATHPSSNQPQDLDSTERMLNFELYEDSPRRDSESTGIGVSTTTAAMVYAQGSIAAGANTQPSVPFPASF